MLSLLNLILLNFTAYLIVAITIPIVSLFFLYRMLIQLILYLKYGQQMTFLSRQDALYAIEYDYECQATVFFIFKGKPNIDAIRKRYESTFIISRNTDGSESFPKFKRLLRQSFGYYFWLPSTVDINQHVVQHEGTPTTRDEFHATLSAIINKPLPRDRPLWMMSVIQLSDDFDTLSGPHYAIFEKYHHALVTGASIVKYWNEKMFDGNPEENVGKLDRSRPPLTKFLLAPGLFLESLLFKDNNPLSTFARSGETILASLSTPIHLERFARIRKAANECVSHPSADDQARCCLTSVIRRELVFKAMPTVNDVALSCLAFALRSHFQRENVPIPSKIRHLMPQAVGVDKVSHALSFLPTAEMTALQRLAVTKRQLNRLKGSNVFSFAYFFTHLFPNVVPGFLANKVLMGSHHTTDISNWFGYQNEATFLESPLVDVGAFTTLTPSVGLFICIKCLNGNIVMSASADTAVVRSRRLLQRILDDAALEICNLETELGIV